MRESNEADSDIRMYSQNIKTAGNTLLGIVNDILDFSKIEEGKLEIINVDYDLSSAVNDLVNMIKTRLDDKGLYLKLDFDKTTPRMLNGDEIRIKQIITNILSNAAKYTEKGSVTFSVSYEKVEDDPNAIDLKVSVRDTGIGIRDEDIEKLFSRFERIEEKRNRSIEGAGLGMNITQMLLEMMGSSLVVESKYGEGSVFSFSIRQKVVKWEPLGDYEETWKQSVKSMAAYKEKFVAPEADILVVDDNSLNLMVFTSLLKRTQIRIDKCMSGDEGITLALKKHYDVIFLDHMMPEKDGVETLHELKENPSNPNIDTPYICLTANAISGAREEYINAGFNDYLTKPINTDELEKMLIRYLPEAKVTKTKAEEDSSQAEENTQELPEALAGLGDIGIDVASGVESSGSLEVYISVLNVFCKSIDGNKAEIEEHYRSGDFGNYTIKVHALKSSARIIGARELGEEAQALENAGKSNDIAYIREHHDAFIERYLAVKEPLEHAIGMLKEDESDENEDKPIADSALLSAVYDEMKSAAAEMDIESLEMILDEMKDYSIPEDEKELFDVLKKAVQDIDYETIINRLEARQ